MTRKIDTLWDHLVELLVACSDAPARDALVAHALVGAGRASAVGFYRRRPAGTWTRETAAGAVEDLPTAAAVGDDADAETASCAWPAGVEVVGGLREGERWVVRADGERAERCRDELEALLVLLRVCQAGPTEADDADPLELAGTALPAEARHAADLDRERERAIEASRRVIEAVGGRLRSWSDDLDPVVRAAQLAEIELACAEAIQRIELVWSRG